MPVHRSRNISLTLEPEPPVDAKGASGRYCAASKVGRAALRLLDERERRADRQSRRDGDAPGVR